MIGRRNRSSAFERKVDGEAIDSWVVIYSAVSIAAYETAGERSRELANETVI